MMETANSADVPIVFIKKTMNPQVRNVLQSITYTIPAGVIDAYHQHRKILLPESWDTTIL